MSTLKAQLQEVMPEGFIVPEPIVKLYEWIENNRLFIDSKEGKRIGFLYPQEKLKASWTDNAREGGTIIEFAASGNENIKYWFGGMAQPEVERRLCVFAQTGGEGSEAAFWVDDNNELKIVHMGSGSGSLLCCILADNTVDFIRLLAIGYDELCWDDASSEPPSANKEINVQPNKKFREWVIETFDTTVPQTALGIVKHPSGMDDEASEDAFWNWTRQYIQ